MATIPGVIHGKTIELERESGLPEGQRVTVEVSLLDEPLDWTRQQRKARRPELTQ